MKRSINSLILAYSLMLISICYYHVSAQSRQSYIIKPVGEEAYEAILQFYQYDKDIPLETKVVEVLKTGLEK